MASICGNNISIYGTRERLAEVVMMLIAPPEISFGRFKDGSCFASQLTDNRDAGHPVAPLYRRDCLVPDFFVPRPLRYEGSGPDGWSAPVRLEHYGFNLEMFGVRNLESGINNDPAKPLMELVLKCSSKWSAPLSVFRELSKLFPDIVLECRFEERGNDILGSRAFQGGIFIAKHDCVNKVTRADCGLAELEDEDDADDDDLGVLSDQFVSNGNIEMDEIVSQCARDTILNQSPRTHHWSDLTKLSYESGVPGLLVALNNMHCEADALSNALETDISVAQQYHGASWLDSCLLRSDEFDAAVDESLEAGDDNDLDTGYTFTRLSIGRAMELLVACADNSPLADALVTILSRPTTRLMCGYHPISILIDAAKAFTQGAAQEGLSRIVGAMKLNLHPIKEAGLVGNAFLNHKSEPDASSPDKHMAEIATSLIVDGLLDQGEIGLKVITDTFGSHILEERGPKLNPGYLFDWNSDKLLRSLLHCGIQGTVLGTELALHAGFDEEFLFQSQAQTCPRAALDTFNAIKGRGMLTQTMNSRLIEMCTDLNDIDTASVYAAQKVEFAMQATLNRSLSRQIGNQDLTLALPRRRRNNI